MARSRLQDPLKIFNFLVVIPGGTDADTVAGFTEVTGLDSTIAMDEKRGGGENFSVQLSPGLPSHGEVTLRRGQIINTQNALASDLFYNWYLQCYHYQADGYADSDPRRDIRVLQLYPTGIVARGWEMVNCLASYYKPFTDLNGGESGNSFEEIRIRHEGFGDPEALGPPDRGGTLSQILGTA